MGAPGAFARKGYTPSPWLWTGTGNVCPASAFVGNLMRYEHTIIVNPPNPPGYVSNKDSMGGFGQLFHQGAPPAPALDLPYLVAHVRSCGLPVEVVEAGAHRLSAEELCMRISENPNANTALVVVRTSLPTIDWDLDVCAKIRRACDVGAIALIGPVIESLLERVTRDPSIDYAVCGEPDKPVVELVRGDPLEQIQGLTYKSRAGEWRSTPERPFERDLDSLHFPAWDLFPVEAYSIPRSSNAGKMRFLPMLTSRGCPYGCNYCPYPVGQGLRWRYRSAENVVDEMEWLVNEFKVEYILFRDPMFSLLQKRVVAICEEIIRRDIKVKWRCETRVDCLDEKTIAVMANAGCVGINFGVESTDPDIQKGVERHVITPDTVRETLAICKQHGIETFAFFIVGLPGDSVKTILDSVEFAVEIEAGWIQFTVSTPFVGTKLHRFAVEHGLIEKDFYKIISSHEGSVGNENLNAAQIHSLHVFAQFIARNLLNRRGILKNANIRNPVYRTAKRAADFASRSAASLLLRVARWYFPRRASA